MENATIGYKGMSSVPSDYLCEDGDMKLAVDAEMRDGSYHATKVPKDSCFHVDGFYPKFYHEPSDGKKYFIGLRHDGDKWVLAAYDKDGEKVEIENAPEADEEGTFGNFCAMGNLVCFTLDKKIVSLQYKNFYYKYIDILKKPIGIKFGAKLEYYNDGDRKVSSPTKGKYVFIDQLKNLSFAKLTGEFKNNLYYCPTSFTDDNLKSEDKVFSVFNTELAQNLSTCKFMFPVILKYAVKLYSGEYINVSPPILIFPFRDNTGLYVNRYSTEASTLTSVWLSYDAYSIYYSVSDKYISAIQELNSLGNIVESIDIFITKQICDIRTDHVVSYEYSRLDAIIDGVNKYWTINYPRFIKNNSYDQLYKQSNFYLIKSIKLNEFTESYENGNTYFPLLKVDGNDEIILSSLEQQKVLSFSSYSNTYIYAENLNMYNSRLLAINVYSNNADIWPIDILCPPVLKFGDDNTEITEESERIPSRFLRKNIYVESDGYRKIALSISNNTNNTNCVLHNAGLYIPLYFEYPCDGYGVFYYVAKGRGTGCIALNRSNLRSASYYFFGSKGLMADGILNAEENDIPRKEYLFVKHPNLIKASNVNDPFTFKDGNSCECGKGSVMAVASMSAPTSQGQFGQYPLFAFCTDGIYAIGIGSDGTIQNCSPYSMDILAGEEALANVGRDIVFASKAGVMSIGEEGRSLLLPAIKEELYGYDNERQKTFVSKVLTDMGVPLPDTTNVYTYITNGVRMAYDYQHGRVILYNPNYGYSYVLDAQSKSWSIMTKQFKDNLNPVAECLMVAPDGQTLHDYSTDEVVEKHGAFLMTRPFKMDAANVMKTIHSLIQRGNLRSKDAVQQALYGSRDLVNWMPVWSSKDIYLRGFRGTGYKYFRLLVFLPEMTQNDGIDGATISYLPRETDQQR